MLPDYLAHACAVGGRLIEAMSEEVVDDELLDGACLIVGTLLTCGGPAADIDGYPDGVLAVRSLVAQLEEGCDTLARLGTVRQVRDWLEWPTPPVAPAHLEAVLPPAASVPEQDVWAERAERGWTEDVRTELTAICDTIIARPEWADRVRMAYQSDDAEEHRAWRLAPLVGVDLWDEAFARLTRDPQSAYRYQELMRLDDPTRLARVVAFAESHLPLAGIASGPADELGLGPGFEGHGCLDTLLQELKRDGVYSAALVAAGLRSPVVRNRNMAIRTARNRSRSTAPSDDSDILPPRCGSRAIPRP